MKPRLGLFQPTIHRPTVEVTFKRSHRDEAQPPGPWRGVLMLVEDDSMLPLVSDLIAIIG